MSENEKSAAEVQRENIKVTSIKEENSNDSNDKEDNEEKHADDAGGLEKNSEEGVKENEENGDNEEKEENEIREDKSIEKLEKTIERLKKRIDKKTGRERELEQQLNAAQEQLNVKLAEGEVPLTKDDIEREAERIASEKVAQKEFENACDRLNKEAAKIDKTFEKKVWEMAADIGRIPGHMIGILDELDNGGAVLNYITNNIDEAEEIYKLTPAKMAVRLARISNKLSEKKQKPISKAPAPIEPIAGGSKSPTVLHDKMSDREWIEARNKQVAERREAKLKSYR